MRGLQVPLHAASAHARSPPPAKDKGLRAPPAGLGSGHSAANQRARRRNAADTARASTPPKCAPAQGSRRAQGPGGGSACADPAGVPGSKGPALPPPPGRRVWRTGQTALAAPSAARARVIQTSPSAGEIIPKEEQTRPVFKALQPIFPPQNDTHVEHAQGVEQRTEAKKASGATNREGTTAVSATVW